MYLRTNFSTSGLVRVLGRWMPAEAQAPGQDVAQRLGQWLSVADVITLRAAHQSIDSPGAARPERARAAGTLDVEDALLRVRENLETAIIAREASAAPEADTGYAHYHRRYLDHQRRMAMSIGALRDRVRQTLAAASPRLAQLAELDAVLERIFGRREQQLLSSVPAFLKQRFDQLRREHPDDAGALSPPGALPDGFAREFQEALLAELDLRLQPVTGMIEALGNEVKPHR
jgi:hypothetical protein